MRQRLRTWIVCTLLAWYPLAATAAIAFGYDAAGSSAPQAAAALASDSSDPPPCHDTRDAPPCHDCAACHIATAVPSVTAFRAVAAAHGRLPALAAASPESFIPDPPRRPPLG